MYTSAFPLFYFLSSGVNALCRLGFPLQALDIVNNAKSPLEVLDHQEVRDAVDQIRSEEDSIYRSKPLVETIKNRYIIIRFRTSSPAIRMSGFLASKISSNNPGKTIIAINEENGQVSLRGVLAKYVANKLSEKGFKAGGHPGYCGANVSPEEIDKFIDVGIDGISIGSNDLTQLILGIDRDNPKLATQFDERNEAVLMAIEKVIRVSRQKGITSSICGQAPSVYPEFTEKLVKWGITSVSVSPDMIDEARRIIADAEAKLEQS